MVIIINVYFASAYLVLPKFRSAQNYPIFLQALFDLFLSGYCSIIDAVLQQLVTSDPRKTDFFYRSFVKCFTAFGFEIAREIVTAITMLAIACQRYICVCKPHLSIGESFSKRLMQSNYFITALTLSIIVVGGIAAAVSFAITGQQMSCIAFDFLSDRWMAIVLGIFSFYIPAPVCTFLYLRVGIQLWKTTSQQERNRQLTVLFTISCFLWILFYLPTKVVSIYEKTTFDAEYVVTRTIFFYLIINFAHVLNQLFSTTQPFIIICCYRPLSDPLLNLVSKLRFPKKSQKISNVMEKKDNK